MNLQGNWWNPLALNTAIKSAFRPSVYTAIADAKAHSPSHVAGASGKVRTDTSAFMRPTGLGFVWERGRPAGYEILPGLALGARRTTSKGVKTVTIKTGNTGTEFLGFNNTPGTDSGTGVRRGPVKGGLQHKDPYVFPAAVRWAQYGYRTVAHRILASVGFGVKL